MTAIIQPKFGRDNEAVRLQLALALPALTGSEKQIAWANDIRAAKMVEFAEELAKRLGTVWGIVLVKDGDFIEQRIGEINAKIPEAMRAGLELICARTAAKDWIDNRTDDLMLALRPFAAAVRAKLAQ